MSISVYQARETLDTLVHMCCATGELALSVGRPVARQSQTLAHMECKAAIITKP